MTTLPSNHTLLAEFLRRHRISRREVASVLRVTHTSVRRWLEGSDRPSLSRCEGLERYSRGEVPAAGWAKPDDFDPSTVRPHDEIAR